MTQLNVDSAGTSNLTDNLEDVDVDLVVTDGISAQKETRYQTKNWSKYFGYYKKVAEVKAATDILVHWTIGDGYIAQDTETKARLDYIKGWGTDTFDDIIENLEKTVIINGDSFAEIIWSDDSEDAELLNLKPLDPSSIVIVVNSKGIIEYYEQVSKADKKAKRKIEKIDMFHLTRGRVADEIHGVSVYESVEPIIQALNESFQDMKTIVHRNVVPLRVVEVDTDDEDKIASLTAKYETLIKNKEVLFIPKDTVKIETQGLPNNSTFNPLPWRETLKNQFYQSIGLPQILVGGAAEFSESSAKIAYVSFENTIKQRQRYIIEQIKNQLYIEIDIDMPYSIRNELISDNSKDGQNQQMGFMPSDMTEGL